MNYISRYIHLTLKKIHMSHGKTSETDAYVRDFESKAVGQVPILSLEFFEQNEEHG